ncbi:MAG: acyclic terpene utilization AtuA family protein [Clostridia bacterium]
MKTVICSPCGILGYGFPAESFRQALAEKPDAIAVDAGSTDAGPHKLGAGVAIVSRMALKKDLSLLMLGAKQLSIPLVIGSAGGSGARVHTEWCLDVIRELCSEMAWKPRIAVIWADIPNSVVLQKLAEGKITKMSENVPELNAEALAQTNGVVAQMGEEPVLKALEANADIILCGRAYDPSPFAAIGIHRGHDAALCYHLGKILECGALCCEPGTTKDCMLGVLEEDSFTVYSPNPKRACTPVSVAAHTFYEKDHPYLLHGPGIVLDLSTANFADVGNGRVRVSGSKLKRVPYAIKLEGARPVAYRTFVLAGIRDPLLISQLDEVEKAVVESVQIYYNNIPKDSYQIHFMHYGKDAVMGELEPDHSTPHEIGLMFEVIAPTQELANAICASVRSTYLHYGYPGRKSTAGNLAFPFAPSDVPFGCVYAFSVYHLMEVEDACELFPMEWVVL